MGLLYIMPKNKKEITQVEVLNDVTRIKSYPLPYIFWFYFLIVCLITFVMIQVSYPLFHKLLQSNDKIDLIIGVITIVTLLAVPIGCLLFLFFQKEITVYRSKKLIQINNRVCFIPIGSKNLEVANLEVKHFLSSPNMAKIQSYDSKKAFQNRGHYILELTDKSGQQHLIDRHTNKADLVGLKNLIEESLV